MTRKRKILLWSMAPFVLGGCTWWGTGWNLERQIEHERRELRKLGAPMSIEEFEAISRHEGRDAAPEIELALEHFKKLPTEVVGNFQQLQGPRSEAKVQVGGRFVRLFQPIYQELQKAATKEVIAYPTGWLQNDVELARKENEGDPLTKRGSLTTPQLQIEFRDIRRKGLMPYVRWLVYLGRTDEALEALQVAHELQYLKADIPTDLSFLLWISEQNALYRTSITLAVMRSHDPEFLEELIRTLDPPTPLPEPLFYLLGNPFDLEINMEVYPVRPPTWQEVKDETADPVDALYSLRRIQRWILLQNLRAWREGLEEVPNARMDFKRTQSIRTLVDRKIAASVANGPLGPFLEEAYWSTSEYFEFVDLDLLALRNSTRCMLRLLLQRANYGSFPGSLPDFGEDSKDPFSGEQLKMLKSGDYLYVYSVGVNRIDDKMSDRELEAGHSVVRLVDLTSK